MVEVFVKKDLSTLYDLAGRKAVITGAARGIGKAVAHLLAAAGASVLVADILEKGAQECAAEIRRDDGKAVACAVDVSQEQAVKQMYDIAQQHFGTVDILVHGAAIFPKHPLLDISVDQWDRIQAVNLRGSMLVMREAIRRMREGGTGGAIVNISSISGEREVVFHNAAYGASKAGTTNLTRAAALEFGGDHIRVNAVLPGGTATEGAREATEAMKESGMELKGPMTQQARVPLGTMGTPDDIAAACLFLVSPAARYITGQCLAVDGGFLVS